MFKNFRLAAKFTLSFVLALLLCGAATWIGITYWNQETELTEGLYEQFHAAQIEILEIQSKVIDLDRLFHLALNGTDLAAEHLSYQAIEDLDRELDAKLARLSGATEGVRETVRDLAVQIGDWRKIRAEIFALHVGGEIDQTRALALHLNAPQTAAIEERIQGASDFIADLISEFRLASAQHLAAVRGQVFTGLLFAYLAAVLIVFAFAKSVVGPIRRLAAYSEEVADGNLGISPVEYGKTDEIGKLTSAVNVIHYSLADLIRRVEGALDSLGPTSERMSTGAQQISASVEELASNANQFSGAVDRLNTNARQMFSFAQRTDHLSRQGTDAIKKADQAMTEINGVVADLASDIRALEQYSQEIEHIIALITGIADQTNLLALNAAIEAARAGEEGRGFAVVAAEVRDLAEQSVAAARQITQLVKEIRNSAQQSVENADLGGLKVQEGLGVITHSGQMFSEIANVIQVLVQEIEDVTSAIDELAAGAEEIGATTEEQSSSVQQMAAAAREVDEGVGEVRLQTQRLRF